MGGWIGCGTYSKKYLDAITDKRIVVFEKIKIVYWKKKKIFNLEIIIDKEGGYNIFGDSIPSGRANLSPNAKLQSLCQLQSIAVWMYTKENKKEIFS